MTTTEEHTHGRLISFRKLILVVILLRSEATLGLVASINHLGLQFHLVNYNLIPGRNISAQFTLAAIGKNGSPLRLASGLNDFTKEEPGAGWILFIKTSDAIDALHDGGGNLEFKFHVRIIKKREHHLFCCLDPKYRRLFEPQLTECEEVLRSFVQEQMENLQKFTSDGVAWSSLGVFWGTMDLKYRLNLSCEKIEAIESILVKNFFKEEITSTLIMDFLYGGLKSLERKGEFRKSKGDLSKELPSYNILLNNGYFAFAHVDAMLLLERAANEPFTPKDDEKGPKNCTQDGSPEFNIEEMRLVEFRCHTIKMFVLNYILSNKIHAEYKAYLMGQELEKEEEKLKYKSTSKKKRES